MEEVEGYLKLDDEQFLDSNFKTAKLNLEVSTFSVYLTLMW